MKWSDLILYRVVTIKANMPPAEAIRLLKPHVDSSLSFFNSSGSFFTGHVIGYRFNMHRRFSGRNSFIPVIKGVVREQPEGCEIKITIRLNFLLLLFVAALLHMNITALRDGTWYFSVLSMFILAFVYLMAWQIFDGEAMQAINFLKDVWRDKQ